MSLVGQLIDDCYRVDRRIGVGSYGVVYACTDLPLRREVAIKMITPGPTTPIELERFATEAENLAKLNHPNVVPIFRLGRHQGAPYLVMELVRGTTLRRLLEARSLPLRQVVRIMSQVASGLAAIHERGILHRDISPSNIMVTTQGVANGHAWGLAGVKIGPRSSDAT